MLDGEIEIVASGTVRCQMLMVTMHEQAFYRHENQHYKYHKMISETEPFVPVKDQANGKNNDVKTKGRGLNRGKSDASSSKRHRSS